MRNAFLAVFLTLLVCACSRSGYAGHIDEVRNTRGGVVIDLDGRYPNQKMVVFIPREYIASMGGHFPRLGTTLKVTGSVTDYKGSPEIIITSPDQLTW